MATSAQIRKHLSMSSSVSLGVAEPSKSNQTKKIRVMEHVNLSKGSKA